MSATELLFEWLCSFLLAAGILLILIELRTRYDKTFLLSGFSIILVTAFAALDIFVLPAHSDQTRLLYWTRIQHVFGAGIVVFLSWYLMVITQNVNMKLLNGIILASGVICPLLFVDSMLRKSPDGPSAGPLYFCLFLPYGLAAVVCFVTLLATAWRNSSGSTRKLAGIHLAGIISLGLCGIVDMVVAASLGQRKLPIPSFLIIGLLAFAAMVALVFTERFLLLIKDRNAAYAKLQSAYVDLEKAAGLRQLGESAAVASHEIKNFMAGLRGNAELLMEYCELGEREHKFAKNVVEGIDNLVRFTRDVLALSKVRVVKDKTPIDLAGLVHHCVEDHFEERKGDFMFDSDWGAIPYHGDWAKLEHVFVNLFSNAFEAGASKVMLKAERTDDILLIQVQDNGRGITDHEQLRNLFTAFHSSKHNDGGTGLGLSITRAIIESHGGHISAYSLNLEDPKKERHGLRLDISLPLFDGIEEGGDGKIVLVQDGLCDLELVVRVLRNVNVYPHLCENLADVDQMLCDPDVVVLMDAVHLPHANNRTPKVQARVLLLSSHNGITYAVGHSGNDTPLPFCEEYVISHVLTAPSTTNPAGE
ncbi:MAG: hypothetical protein GF331_14335 [Chitinivibrionales bacterium]|nr:hypothetical protein [Chitinivibrionales bacterium]